MTCPSERDRGMAIAMLAEAFRLKELTPATIRIYDTALQAVPVAVLGPMVQRAITTRQFFPKVSELLADADTCRRAMLDALRFEPCVHCSVSGWTEIEIDGVKRMQRCRCWRVHQERVDAFGVGHEPLALPAATGEKVIGGDRWGRSSDE